MNDRSGAYGLSVARTKSADPEGTRDRVLEAAIAIAIEDGLALVTTRTVAEKAKVGLATVHNMCGGIGGLHAELISFALTPLGNVIEKFALLNGRSLFEAAIAPFRIEPGLATLVMQVTALAGLRAGRQQPLASEFDRIWSQLRTEMTDDPDFRQIFEKAWLREDWVDRLMSLYVAAAFHLSRRPELDDAALRTLLIMPRAETEPSQERIAHSTQCL